MKRSADFGFGEAPVVEELGESSVGAPLDHSGRSLSRRLPFNRADAFGAILEAATSSPASCERESNSSYHIFIRQVQALQNSPEPRTAAIARSLLEVMDQIAVERARAPLATGALRPPSTGAFLLAIDLVFAKDPAALLERTRRTLQVPPELAEKIISVLRETDW